MLSSNGAICLCTHRPASLADDSGLEVDAPQARLALQRVIPVLMQLMRATNATGEAHARCTGSTTYRKISVCDDDAAGRSHALICQGTWEDRIVFLSAGETVLVADPLFWVEVTSAHLRGWDQQR